MKTEIINVGSEILLGDILNTNARYLSSVLNKLGCSIYYHTSVGDNQKRLKKLINLALERSELIVLTGGLGPTLDDITREITSEALEIPLEHNPKIAEEINCYFKERGITMPKNNLRQAKVPRDARILHNSNGTAPGLLIETKNNIIVLLPGPPNELKAVVEESLLPLDLFKPMDSIVSTTIKTYGIGESQLVEKIEDLIQTQSNPTIAPLAKEDGVHIRLTYKGNQQYASHYFSKYKKRIDERLGNYIWGYDNQQLNQLIIDRCAQKKLNLSTVESCTSGAVSSLLTDVSGSSKVFWGGNIVYTDNCKKEFLSLNSDIPNGGVDKDITEQLAGQLYIKSGCDICLAVTGALGPSTPHNNVSVGDVFISTILKGNLKTSKFKFRGSRETIKSRVVYAALFKVLKEINTL
ncbi:competence/damage-inducible protein A [Proteinivorax tanatarense]|uniref:Putative competence-damage inducible protein n=1 Tax=Proteinivorax tanatarense TaxID=1260629 RepID=A0AAU7VQE6_9FIRM